MVRACLRLVGRPHADAAVLIKELDRRRRILRPGAGITSAAKLPVLLKAQLASTWRSGTPLVAIGVQYELDKATAAILAALAGNAWNSRSDGTCRSANSKSRRARRFERSLYLSLLHENEKPGPYS
jgi:hypothetical protein